MRFAVPFLGRCSNPLWYGATCSHFAYAIFPLQGTPLLFPPIFPFPFLSHRVDDEIGSNMAMAQISQLVGNVPLEPAF